jgi:putative SOS response-associated peptidase YedK
MAGLEGIDASKMDIVDALGVTRWEYDPGERVARPVVRHADFVPVAIRKADGLAIEKVRFGLPVAGGRLLTNARDDKVAVSGAWKGLFEKSRCMTAISFVVERDAKTGETYRIQRRDGRMIVVAGLYAMRHWKFTSTGNEYDELGHVQVTADANDFVAQVHDRFVVELDTRKDQATWMDPAAAKEDLLALLGKAPDERYEMVPVDPQVWTKRDLESIKPRGPPVVWTGKPTRGKDEKASSKAAGQSKLM